MPPHSHRHIVKGFSITCIRSTLPYLEHLITLLLSSFTLNFLLSHTLPHSLTNLHNFSSESATSAVSSANNSLFISNLSPFALRSSNPFPSTLTFTSRTTPSIYTLNNHGDITQPCLNPTFRLSLIDRVRRVEVRWRAGIERELASRVVQRGSRWFANVERMDEYLMARRVLKSKISRWRVRGIPMLGWMDDVKTALGNRGMTA